MATESKDLSFKVLSLLSKERGVYGLRNGDHERYRNHCSNKLHRLRQVTGLTSGKGKVYKKPAAITDATVKDVRHLQLLLFSAERALAHSHELKSLRTKPNAPGSTRKEQISWLRSALKSSTSLHTIVSKLAEEGKVNQRTLAEITIYHLSVRAELSFERSQWAEALTDLSARRKLLSTLSDAARDSFDQALALEFMDAYDPLIRFGAYKLGRAESHDIEGVVSDVDDEMLEEAVPGFAKLVEGLRGETGVEEMEKGRKELEDVQFAGDKVEMRSAEIVGVMLRVQEVLGKMGKSKGMRGWDRVLGVLGEAEAVARRLLEDHQASSSSTSLRSNATSQSLSVAHQYILHLLLSHRIRRDLLLVDTLSTSSIALPADVSQFKIPGGKVRVEEAVKSLAAIIKLYDTVLQSIGQVRSLAIVEEKDGVRVGVEGLEAYFHATRLFHLARLHCIHPAPSYASAVQLLSRASNLLRQARTQLETPDVPIEETITSIPSSSLDDLESRISTLDHTAKRSLFGERVTKPVFFDTAFNYIDLPMDDLLVRAGKAEAAPVTTAKAAVDAAVNLAGKTVEKVAKEGPKGAAEAVQRSARTTRESTPAVEENEEGGKGQKGWLGGWFGRK
ncbi:hypothetical protein JCM24511_02391 [Saitozyma sp. JCM 24511]|nr:hypothetical protein JCM24511_02391 [Saitozyma sp. JCM 24511]